MFVGVRSVGGPSRGCSTNGLGVGHSGVGGGPGPSRLVRLDVQRPPLGFNAFSSAFDGDRSGLSSAPLYSSGAGRGRALRLETHAYRSRGGGGGYGRGRGRGRGPPKPRGPPKNEDIRAREVRVIGSDRSNLGVMKTSEALSMAREEGLDLVEVTPGADPPVCRIVDFGKFMYEQEKKKKEAKKGQSKAKSAVKELKLRPNTDVHDYNVRLKKCLQFLGKGNKVKITVVFAGRDMAYKDKGRELLARFQEDIGEENGHVDGRPNMQGRQMMMFINPGPKKEK